MSDSPSRFLGGLLFLVTGMALPVLLDGLSSNDVHEVTLVLVSVALVFVFRCRGLGVGVGPLVLAFYLLFHHSLILFFVLPDMPELLTSSDRTWATAESVATASVPATAFALVFAGAYGLVMSRRHDKDASPVLVNDESAATGAPALVVRMAPLVLLGGLAMWTQYWAESGVGIRGQYVQFLEATADRPMVFAYLFISLGMGLIGGTQLVGLRRVALVGFLAWMMPAFLLGLRGEVLIPLMVFFAARTRSGRSRVRLWVAGLMGLGVAAAGSFVRVTRDGFDGGLQELNPLYGLLELGYSIRPMVYVQRVHDVAGAEFVGLSTYWAPLERLILGQILGQPVTAVGQDQAVFSTFIATNYGQIGGSVSAEAYRAQGMVGIVLVAALLAVLIGLMDRSASTFVNDAGVAMVAAVLLLWVRNDFTPVPFSLAVVAVIFTSLRVGRSGADRPKRTALVRGSRGVKATR